MPLVDFSREWSDEEIYDLIGLTGEERKVIDDIIPDYYGRNNPSETPIVDETKA